MNEGVCLELQYDGQPRLVEVHAVGVSSKGNTCMRVFQIEGGSSSGESTGWKLMTFDKANSLSLSSKASEAPRPGYAPGDKHMSEIFGEV